MQVRKKIFLLLVFLFGFFSVVLSAYLHLEKKRQVGLFQGEKDEIRRSIDTILGLKSASLSIFASDYSVWDETILFVESKNFTWAKVNLDPGLDTFSADILQVYDPAFFLVYKSQKPSFEPLNEPFPPELKDRIFRDRKVHFFTKTTAGYMEIYGAMIVHSGDIARAGAPHGYFIVGRLWDKKYLDVLEQLTESTIKVFSAERLISVQSEDFLKGEIIHVTKDFLGLDDKLLFQLDFEKVSHELALFGKSALGITVLMFVFVTGVFLLLGFFLFHWISEPLLNISAALRSENVFFLERFEAQENEFGEISQLIRKSFDQKNQVNAEIAERKRAQGEMKKSYEQLKNAQLQITQSTKMASLGQLAGGVAHEINNPLTGVLNNVQLIKMMAVEKKDFALSDFIEMLNVIEESALRCTKITRSLLDFSHVSQGSMQQLSLNDIAEKVLILLLHETKLANINLVSECASGLPAVSGDSQLLQQVVFDLITNAKWAIQKKSGLNGGNITIRTEPSPNKKYVILSIADTGIGITREAQQRIFEPFFTTKPVGEGTGLGLAIVFSIIQKHNGLIEVESEPGIGTTFRISLPVSVVKEGGA